MRGRCSRDSNQQTERPGSLRARIRELRQVLETDAGAAARRRGSHVAVRVRHMGVSDQVGGTQPAWPDSAPPGDRPIARGRDRFATIPWAPGDPCRTQPGWARDPELYRRAPDKRPGGSAALGRTGDLFRYPLRRLDHGDELSAPVLECVYQPPGDDASRTQS